MITIIKCDTVEEALTFLGEKRPEWINNLQMEELCESKGYKFPSTRYARLSFCQKHDIKVQKRGGEYKYLVGDLKERV